jgi:hypothetical protein
MGETITIRTGAATEVIKVIEQGPQGPVGPKGDPGDVAGLPLTTTGDTLYRANSTTNARLPIGTTGQVLKVVGGLPAWAEDSGGVSSWNDLTDKPSTFAPSAHTHPISDVTNLQTALDGKAASSHTHTANQVTDFNTAAAAAAPVQSVAGRTGAVTLAVADVSGAVASTDSRLSDSRTPSSTLAHAASHLAGTPAVAASYTGIGDSETFSEEVTITADTAGTAGNSITLTFDGVDDVDTVLDAWNAANPSNQATKTSGDGAQVPDDGDELTLSGGVAAIAGGSDPFANINQDLGTTDSVQFAGLELNSPSNGEILRIEGNGSSDVGFAVYNNAGNQANSFYFNQNNDYIGIGVGASRNYIQSSLPVDVGAELAVAGPINITGASASTHKATTRTNLGAAASGSITSSGLTQSTARILGRTTASTGSIEEIQIGSGLSLSAGELSATGGGGGDTVSIQSTAADILSVSSGAISADDAGATRIVYWNDTNNKLTYGTPSDVGAAASSHTHSDATQSVAGFLSTADKTKLDGIASGANNYTHPNHTGDVTSAGDGATTIANNAVTNAKLAQVASSTLKGRATAATGNVEDLTASQVRTILNVADGAEVNVNADWNASSGDAQILNKPTLGTAAAAATTDFAAAAHNHAASAITSGTLDVARIPTGTTSTTVALGNHGHELTSLAATGATNGHVLTANGSGGVTFSAATGGSGVTAVGPSTADVLSVSGSDLVADDPNADRIVFWDDSESKWRYLEAGSGLTISGTTMTASGGIGGGTGSTDNSILRSDGTGGSTLQASAIVIEDAVSPINITGDAGTDIITAVGHNYTANQGVRFPTLTGGSGLTAATTNYFVRDISGDTFKVSTTSGGSAVNFTTNITAGTVIAMQANVAIVNNSSETNSALVLTPKGTGAFIVGPRPDGTTVGANPRGDNAIDLQTSRNAATQVASGTRSAILCGSNNTASGQEGVVIASQSSTASGSPSCILVSASSTANGDRATIIASGNGSSASNSYSMVLQGFQTTSSGAQAMALGNYALADRTGMMARAYFVFASAGDAQRAWYAPLFNKTSVATATELFTDGSAIRLTIPSGKTISMFINIVAATSGGEFANRYVRAVTIANRGGTTALRGAVKDIDTEEQIAGADVTISANDTNDALRVEFSGVAPVTGCTAAASTDVISKTAHGFSNNDDIIFSSLTGGTGLTANTVTYWVINATADTFQVSATRGGSAVNITADYSAMTAARLFRVVAYIDGAEVAFGT